MAEATYLPTPQPIKAHNSHDLNDNDTDERLAYDKRIQALRKREYPMLQGMKANPGIIRTLLLIAQDAIYLDHAGTTLYSKSLIERFASDMITNLYGNPHSGSASSQLATRRIENIRHDVLHFFGASSSDFDLVFVANTTAGAKLVMDAFRDYDDGFWYGYHIDSHTSLVGIREAARLGHRCFASDEEVEDWMTAPPGNSDSAAVSRMELFQYPAQSNMDGRKLPLDWSQRMRVSNVQTRRARFTLLDAAAYAATKPLNLSNPDSAPDFTVVSFNKIFGFPDLGALIVRKESAHVLARRRYFGGGTVDMVSCNKEQWHEKKRGPLHAALEDGTLPIHGIISLSAAMDVHRELFESMDMVSKHTSMLADRLYAGLATLQHTNGIPVCKLYRHPGAGPTVSFNVLNTHGEWISNSEVEKLASIKSFHIRSGGLCNPGGIAQTLGLEPWELKANFSAGHKCGADDAMLGGKPSGMTRVSLGAMSTRSDVDSFVSFIKEYFVASNPEQTLAIVRQPAAASLDKLYVESLTVYPLKSCAGWRVPEGADWDVRAEGLAWDREWCLVHQGTSSALSQKKYPKMALVRPAIDLDRGVLRIRYAGFWDRPSDVPREIEVPLSADPTGFASDEPTFESSVICDDVVAARRYQSPIISAYFTAALGVPCQLARFPPASAGQSTRHMKQHLGMQRQHVDQRAFQPLLLSNESPILTISRSSLNRLNEDIKARGGRAAQAESFRANIVVAQALTFPPGTEQAYAEDDWSMLCIGRQYFELLGSCRRCQMVCIDQETAERNIEPFATLAKTRRYEGKVWFGQHTSHVPLRENGVLRPASIKVGDRVRALYAGDESRAVRHAAYGRATTAC